MTPKPSRTTKKARELLPGRSVDVAVPAERLGDEIEDAKPSLLQRARQTAANGTERDVILAFGDHGVFILSTKPSNPGLPASLLLEVAEPPELVDDTDQGLVVRLDGEDHRVGRIHAGSVRTFLHAEPAEEPPEEPQHESEHDEPQSSDVDTGDVEAEPDADETPASETDVQDAPAPETDVQDASAPETGGREPTDPQDAAPAPTRAEVTTPEPIPILDDFGPAPVQDAAEPDSKVERPPDSDGPKVPTNKTTTRAQQTAPAAGILYAVPARAEQPVLRHDETEATSGAKKALRTVLQYVPLIGIGLAGTRQRDPHDVVLAFDADGTRVFTTSARNPAVPREEVVRIADADATPELGPNSRSGLVVSVAHMTFAVGPIYADGLRAFLALDDRTADMAPLRNAWTEVVQEFENQFRIPADLDFPVESRSRSTIQCQRLLRDRWVALAVPGRAESRPDSDDPKGNFVIAFTDEGPWLFAASSGNPALPREPLGPIEEASPISFSPHEREGGVLAFNGRAFLIPIAYADSLRQLIVQMSQG